MCVFVQIQSEEKGGVIPPDGKSTLYMFSLIGAVMTLLIMNHWIVTNKYHDCVVLSVGIVGGCAGTRYGCCQDGVNYATGPNFEGCSEGEKIFL